MEMTAYSPGAPCWVDLMTPDTTKARAFYGALLGWEVPDGDPAFGGYANATLRGKTVAGVLPKMAPELPTVWSTYIAVADAQATLAAAVAAGGTVMVEATHVGLLGSMGVFTDPQGAVCGVWQPGLHIGAQLVNEPGAMRWHELSARDLAVATAFYPAVFGWEVTPMDPAQTYFLCSVAGVPVAGMMATPEQVPDAVPSHWAVYFEVDDCDQAVAAATALGGQKLIDPITAEGVGRFCALSDDQGAMFWVIRSHQAQ